MCEQIPIAGREYETPAELKWIAADAHLTEALCPRFGSCLVVAKDMQQVRGLQSGRAVGFPIAVNEERERDPGLFAEQSRIMLIAQADRGNICVLCSKFRFMLAQLRDVLPAEDSAVMPEERDYGGLVFPQRSEADLPVPGIGQYDIGERSAERRIGHLSLDQ